MAPPGASLASFWAPRKKLAAAAAKLPDPAAQAPPHRALVWWTAKENGIPLPRLLRHSQRSKVVGGHHPPRAPPRNLCPTAHKGARSNGGTTMLGNPRRQRQRWGRQRQSPSHPRLCENHKRSLIGGPRKTGGSRGETAWRTRPRGRSSTCGSPGASLASFWAPRKKLAAASGEILQTRRPRRQQHA